VFNTVQDFGDAGNAIVEDECVATVLFTDSVETATRPPERSDDPGKLATCEMGSKNGIVAENADLDIAVYSAMMSSFKPSSQRCISSEQLIVHTDVYDEIKERFVDLAENISIGDLLDGTTYMGPIVNESQIEKYHKYNDLARSEGANVLVDRAELNEEEILEGVDGGYWMTVRLRNRIRFRSPLSQRGRVQPARRASQVRRRHRGRHQYSQRYAVQFFESNHLRRLLPAQLSPGLR
jgi:aldehyde dehydrogenase (NAD+)